MITREQARLIPGRNVEEARQRLSSGLSSAIDRDYHAGAVLEYDIMDFLTGLCGAHTHANSDEIDCAVFMVLKELNAAGWTATCSERPPGIIRRGRMTIRLTLSGAGS